MMTLSLAGCVQSFFYYPDRVRYGSPADQGLKFEEVVFDSKDGTKLSGWFIPAASGAPPRQAKGTVIHFHGNAQNMSSHWQFVSWLPKRGFNVFVFDYRGYGLSAGKPTPEGLFKDCVGALDYVRSRPDVDPSRLAILGQSLGGANAIAAVGAGNREGIRAMAIEATFRSYSAIANEKMVGAGLLMDDRFSADRYVASLAPIPLLLIHGMADQVVPHTHSQRLYDLAGQPKQAIFIEGAGHLEALTPRFGAHYQDILASFFEASVINARP